MTFRDKLQQDHPEYDEAERFCPRQFGYEAGEPCKCSDLTCGKCWDREIPGTEPKTPIRGWADEPAPTRTIPEREPAVYISGPITGVERYWEAFEEAAHELIAAGFIPLSPAWLPEGLTEAQYMEINLAMLNAADAVYFLPRYRESRGAMVEYRYAKYIRKPNTGDIEELKKLFFKEAKQ